MVDEREGTRHPASATPGPPTERDEAWVRWALRACIEAARRRGVRYARRLREQRDPADAMADLLILGARRVVPLPERRVRALPRLEWPPEARAFMALERADRDVLWRLGRRDGAAGGRDAAGLVVAEQEHAAAALMRWIEALGSEGEGLAPGREAWPRQEAHHASGAPLVPSDE